MCGFVLKTPGALQSQKRASDAQDLVLEDEFASSPRAGSTLNNWMGSPVPHSDFIFLNPYKHPMPLVLLETVLSWIDIC